MVYPLKLFLLAMAALLLPCACATLKYGRYQQIAITSVPPGALVWVNNYPKGITPGVIELKRNQRLQLLSVELPGYQPYEVLLKRKINNQYYYNAYWPLGFILDACTGAMYTLYPEHLLGIELIPQTTPLETETR